MRQAFMRRACRSMPLLAALALVSSASVQSAPPPAPIAEQGNRISEIRVELAWLGDPLTFPCQMAAHVSDAGLEVRGFVPSLTVREHALPAWGTALASAAGTHARRALSS